MYRNQTCDIGFLYDAVIDDNMPRPRPAGQKPRQNKKLKQNTCMNKQTQLDEWLVL
jgi:hypothetical protein